MKLTNTQLALLFTASQRPDRAVEIPPHLKGAAAQNLISRLLGEHLIEDIRARGSLPVWRHDGRGGRALRITSRGVKYVLAQYREPPDHVAPDKGRVSPPRSERSEGPSKQDRLIGLLARRKGATISDLMRESGWQQHSVRGFLAGVVRKKLGLSLVSSTSGRGRIYRVVKSERSAKASKPK